MVRPSSLATARGHLDNTSAKPPHETSEAVSALQHFHKRNSQKKTSIHQMEASKIPPFDYSLVPRSATIHLDYTGQLPEIGSNGTRVFMITSWGRYIHLQPLTNLRDDATTTALKEAILFWRSKGITIDSVRMDNQCSNTFKQMTTSCDLLVRLDFVPPNDKGPNRAERAIRTAKNHLISARAGFHKDCPTMYLDKCLFQIEMALNLLHPFEYDPTISAYQGVFGHTFNFK
jgi:hypothetical protein